MHDVQASIRLTDDELARMKRFSDRIHRANRRRQRRHRQGWKPRGREAVDARYLGYCAQRAFANFLGVKWPDFDVDAYHFRKRPDVGGYDVKSTTLVTGRLIVTPLDDDDRMCVLVICREPEFDIVGYYNAGNAKRPEWWSIERDGGGAWYVPRDLMLPVPARECTPSRLTVDVSVDTSSVRSHIEAVTKILDDARAFDDAEADRLDQAIARKIESVGPVERGDWRAVLRAAGVEPPDVPRCETHRQPLDDQGVCQACENFWLDTPEPKQ